MQVPVDVHSTFDQLKIIGIIVGMISVVGGFLLWLVIVPATQKVTAKMLKAMEIRLEAKDVEREKRYDIKYADGKEVTTLTATMGGFGETLKEISKDVKDLLTKRK